MSDTRGRLDKDAARELELYMDNDAQIYRSRITPIKENLRKKIAKGNFDPVRSIDLWMYAVEDAAKKYHKEFGGPGRWNDMFSRPTRRVVAYRSALQFMEDEGLPVSNDDWKKGSLDGVSLGATDPDDVPWVCLSYGEMPSKAAFDRQYRALVDGDYPMGLNREDERMIAPFVKLIGGVKVDSSRKDQHFNILVSKDKLYDLIRHLAHHGYGDEANDLASSILQTLNIEWI